MALKISAIMCTTINESKAIQMHNSMGRKKLTCVNNLEMRLFFGGLYELHHNSCCLEHCWELLHCSNCLSGPKKCLSTLICRQILQ